MFSVFLYYDIIGALNGTLVNLRVVAKNEYKDGDRGYVV